MLVAGIVLAITFIAIFTEQLHGFERPKVAATGAIAMIVLGQLFGFYSTEAAVEAVDWDVIFLLAAMMTIVSIMIPTGGFAWMAYKIAVMSRGRLYLGLEQQGVNVAPLWWGLALGVGLGGNGTHIGSTANVFIVTISERLAREQNDPSLAITPGLWFRKGTPVMLVTLVISTVVFSLFFDFFSQPVN